MQENIEDFKETKYTYKGELKMLLTPDKKDNYADILYMPSSTVECCFSEKKITGSGNTVMNSIYDIPTNSQQPNAEASQNFLPDINLEELISYVKAGKIRKNRTSRSPAKVHCSINFDPLSIPITPPQPLIEDGEPRTQPCKKRRKFTPSRKRSHDSFQFKKIRSGNVKLYFADDTPSNFHPVAKKIRLNSGQQSKQIDKLFKDDNKHGEVVVEIVLENSEERPNDSLGVDDSVEWCETEIHALSLNSSGHVAVENEKSNILSSQEMSLLRKDKTESEYQETDIVENVELNKKEIGKDLLNNSACDQFQPAKTSEMCQNNSTDIKPSISNSSELLDTVAEVENFLTVHHTSSLSSANAEKHLVGTDEDTNLFSSSVKCVALFNDNTSITKYKQCQIALCDYKTGSDNHSEISSSQSKMVQPTNNIVKTKKSVLDLNNENVDIQESGMIDEGNIRPMRKTRSSTTKIRKTLPKIQVRHTPLGLPKVVRMKKEKFSLEEIYLNKNFRTPTEKKWETIFEFPKENKDGSVSTTEKKKKRRMCDFSTDPAQRKTRSKKSKLKGRKYVSRCKAEESEKLLFQKLYRLDTDLTLAQLSP